jgi:hypothetical protein
MKRLDRFSSLSKELASWNDEELAARVACAPQIHQGIGGRSALLTVDETPVFVKKIPLTDLERLPNNLRRTSNVFGLPMFCQYRLEGVGFGAWRELAAHEMTTDWVTSGKCENFPLLYHWRIMRRIFPGRVLPGKTQAIRGTEFGDGGDLFIFRIFSAESLSMASLKT